MFLGEPDAFVVLLDELEGVLFGVVGNIEMDDVVRLELATRFEHDLPVFVIARFNEEPFDFTVGGCPTAKNSSGDYTCIVDDDEVAGLEELGEVGDDVVPDGEVGRSCKHEAGVVAAISGDACDEVVGEVVVKIGESHGEG